MDLNYIGADIAFETFVIGRRSNTSKGYSTKTHKNNGDGITALISTLDVERDCVVMEATGVYHLRLAYMLCERGVRVCVCNPLYVRRFAEMRGKVAKTDELDSIVLLEYGEQERPPLYRVPEQSLDELRQRRSLLGSLQKRLQMSKNNLHHFEQHPRGDGLVKDVLQEEIAMLEGKIAEVSKMVCQIINNDYEGQKKLLMSVPGVGEVVASCIIDAANSFQGFEDSEVKQFVKHAGLCPSVKTSGKTIRGMSRITRSGTPELRSKLYLPAMNVALRMKDDNLFKRQYQRLRERGKSFKVAIVAVMHKLLRVAIAVLKSKEPFDSKKHGVLAVAK